MAELSDDPMDHHARALAALGQSSRLRIVRLLADAGPEGLPAGEIGKRLGLAQNSSSTHLSVLTQAGLLTKRQQGRLAIYALEAAAMRRLRDLVGSLAP